MFDFGRIRKLGIGTIILLVLAVAVSGFTSLKTIDILQLTMPAGQSALAWVGWGCFEGGLGAWIIWRGHGARRDQRTIAGFMVVFNLIAIIAAFVGDTFLVASHKGLVVASNWLPTLVIWCVCIVVSVNLIAVVTTHLYDPDTRKRVREEEYTEALEEAEEQARHKIEIARLKHIAKNAEAIAPQIGYQQGMDWMYQMYNRYSVPGLPAPAQPPVQPQIPSSTPVQSYPDTSPLTFPTLNGQQSNGTTNGQNGSGAK